MKKRPLAAIDIGTNTLRLLIAEVHVKKPPDKYSIKEIFSERKITRLGAGLCNNGIITEEALEKSITALNKFSRIISECNVTDISVFATSALREASNRDEFIRRAKEETGFDIEIISGKKEAEITALGMLVDIELPRKALLLDIGGGSTECIFINNRKTLLLHSLTLGVVYLAEKYITHGPVSEDLLLKMKEEITDQINSFSTSLNDYLTKDTILIGTAGTVTTLAAVAQNLMSFDHQKIHNFKLNIKAIESIFKLIAGVSAKERSRYIPFETERLDIIVPGTLILLTFMSFLKFNNMIVSNYGLREGMLIEMSGKKP